LFTALAIKKRKPLLEESNLPKIKDPVVIRPPKPAPNTAATPAGAATTSTQPTPEAAKQPVAEEKKEENAPATESTAAENKEEINSSNTEN